MTWSFIRSHRLHQEMIEVGLALESLGGPLDEHACLYSLYIQFLQEQSTLNS